MSLWFAASAVTPQLRAIWGLTTSEAAWLTTIVQLGFVVGTALAALLNLPDLIPSGRLFSGAAFLGAAANAAILAAPGYKSALVLRFLTGFFLAGVYPPAMKMIATWFRSQRGLAIGVIVGALTIGKATPYLVRAIPHVGLRPVVLTASVGAVIAGVLVALGYRDGPFPFTSRPFSWRHVRDVVRVREWRLATASYLGHMFELYAFWTWIPAFLAASIAASAGGRVRAPRLISLLAFTTIAIGGIGSVWGGLFADKRGRERLVAISLFMSGSCCLLSGLLFGATHMGVGGAGDDVGIFRHRGQRPIQHAGDRVSSDPRRGNRAHRADFFGIPVDDASNADCPAHRAESWLALEFRDPRAGSGRRNRRDSKTGRRSGVDLEERVATKRSRALRGLRTTEFRR